MSIVYQIGLTLIPGVGQVTARNLLQHFGTAEAIFKAGKKDLLAVAGIGSVTAAQIIGAQVLAQAEAQARALQKQQIKVLFLPDEDYPRRLRECADAPVLLYYKGTANLNHHRIISVVGTRMATDYGKQLCKQLMEVLKAFDVLVVSGLAYGIDIAAHKESLRQGMSTVGVLGHGLDRVYPYHHKQIAEEMLQQGGLLTEFPLYTGPDRENFPKRNRIIAGLADATIVVEATLKGGALISAELANSYHRDVFAFPGRVHDECSRGCNFLIKTNRAALISEAKDLSYMMGWAPVQLPASSAQYSLPLGLCEEEDKVLRLLSANPLRIDDIAARTAIAQSKLAIHLLNLEMQGLLTVMPGKLYKGNAGEHRIL